MKVACLGMQVTNNQINKQQPERFHSTHSTVCAFRFTFFSYLCKRFWRDAGVVDRGGLENR